MPASLRRAIRISLGVTLILLGVAGLVLPFLQGFLLISAGILLLAPDSRVGRWLIRQLRRAMAWIGRAARRFRSEPARRLRRPFKWLASKLRRKRQPADGNH